MENTTRGTDRNVIFAKLVSGELEIDAAERQLAGLRPKPTLYWKIGHKHGISVYGLQILPVTLYADQWLRLFDRVEEIRTFIEKNRGVLRWPTPPAI